MTLYLSHCHHSGGNLLIEPTHDPQERFRWVEENKPQDEIELRFALFTVIDGEDAAIMDAAWKKYNKAVAPAWAEYSQASYAEYSQAFNAPWAEYASALAAAVAEYNKVCEEVHRRRCHPNCPWDGETIFARGKDAMRALWPGDTWNAAREVRA
jgi:hypothetical protein